MVEKTVTKNSMLLLLVGFAGSALLLSSIHAPLEWSFLAWIAWVPFMLGCKKETSTWKLMLAAYGVGLCYWLSNLFWLRFVTLPGYIGFAFFLACYWPVMALLIRFIRRKAWALVVLAPVVFVGAEAIQSVLFTGFSWFFLAHSQYDNLKLIQIADIFGALGVSVLIAMVNGLFAQFILKTQISKHWRVELLITSSLLAGAYLYGNARLSESSQYITDGPLVGSVQPNVPSYVKEEMDNAQEILDEMMISSDHCIDAGAKLVIWPETMVLAPMNREYLYGGYRGSPESKAFRNQILNHCRDRAFVLFGAAAAIPATGQQHNSAYLYRADGTADPKRYDKIHLVPFGETIPFKNSARWLYNIFMFFNPYDYDYSLTSGEEYTRFDVTADGQDYQTAVLICYEDTDPKVTRKLSFDKKANKKTDWLVNISNDGWYVSFKDQKVTPTGELAQRTAISVFRCVENRISIVRSVNCGISCLIEPTGAIRDGYEAGNLPETAMKRQVVAGWFVDRVPIDERITVFSRLGGWLDVGLDIGFIFLLTAMFYDSWKRKKRRGSPENAKSSD